MNNHGPLDARSPRLLVVDDDERTARRFASMLEEDGYRVEVLCDGAEALQRLANGPPPSAIVTDLVMPKASGLTVLGEARRLWSAIPVIFVTGHPELARAASMSHFDPPPLVFTKPISYPEFSATLRALLAPKT